MTLNVSKEMREKLKSANDFPILDSDFGENQDGTHYEKTQGTHGVYISSEADGWTIRGPFDAAL